MFCTAHRENFPIWNVTGVEGRRHLKSLITTSMSWYDAMYICPTEIKQNLDEQPPAKRRCIGNQSNRPAMTTTNVVPKAPRMPTLAPSSAPLVVAAAAVKLTGAGAVDAFRVMLTFDATKVGPPPAPVLLTSGARYGTYMSGFKAPANVPVRFSSRSLVVMLLFWYEVVFATKAKTSGRQMSVKLSKDTRRMIHTSNGLVGVLATKIAETPVILDSRETKQVT